MKFLTALLISISTLAFFGPAKTVKVGDKNWQKDPWKYIHLQGMSSLTTYAEQTVPLVVHNNCDNVDVELVAKSYSKVNLEIQGHVDYIKNYCTIAKDHEERLYDYIKNDPFGFYEDLEEGIGFAYEYGYWNVIRKFFRSRQVLEKIESDKEFAFNVIRNLAYGRRLDPNEVHKEGTAFPKANNHTIALNLPILKDVVKLVDMYSLYTNRYGKGDDLSYSIWGGRLSWTGVDGIEREIGMPDAEVYKFLIENTSAEPFSSTLYWRNNGENYQLFIFLESYVFPYTRTKKIRNNDKLIFEAVFDFIKKNNKFSCAELNDDSYTSKWRTEALVYGKNIKVLDYIHDSLYEKGFFEMCPELVQTFFGDYLKRYYQGKY
ncbi:hypothetical protein [Halobacteriovorax sp. ZH2_bin.1]|uniref:hypothetical protein n=1 Tax=unclassified Halobacteriovorax TaxID=2639665 RepID=UPI003721D312